MARPLQASNLKRRGPSREPKRRILIVCEGRQTEPNYFRTLRNYFRNPLVELEIDGGGGGKPKTLVERAKKRKKVAEREAKAEKDAFLRFDEVWCVFDVDEHSHLKDAEQQARDNGIEAAVSNPCFELWALLHFEERSAFLRTDHARRLLKSHLPRYEKLLPFDRLAPNYEDAVRRASVLDQRCNENGCPGGNPSTGVYRLAERIREGGKGVL